MSQSVHERRVINGVFLLDKERGISSNSALQKVKRLFAAQKAGHTGVLDPLAEGLLPICLGEATKFSRFLLAANKSYVTTLHLGVATATADAEGEVIARSDYYPSLAEFQAASLALTGVIRQTPPMYSALKHQGKPLYHYARQGHVIEREPRQVVIHAIKILDYAPPQVTLEIDCSKGTYIRTLAEDIAKKAGTLAYLTRLRRIKTGDFGVENAHTLQALAAAEEVQRHAWLLPIDVQLQQFAAFTATDEEVLMISQGKTIAMPPNYAIIAPLRCYDKAGRFIGLVQADSTGERLKVLRLMNTAALSVEGS